MAKPEQSRTGDPARVFSGTQTLSARSTRCDSSPNLCSMGSTNIELPLGSERALSDGEDRQHFDCATWLHKAREMSKGKVKREVEKELTGRETEAWETNHASVGPLRIGAPPFAPWPGPSSLQREDEPPCCSLPCAISPKLRVSPKSPRRPASSAKFFIVHYRCTATHAGLR